jgi:hypothetical protein
MENIAVRRCYRLLLNNCLPDAEARKLQHYTKIAGKVMMIYSRPFLLLIICVKARKTNEKARGITGDRWSTTIRDNLIETHAGRASAAGDPSGNRFPAGLGSLRGMRLPGRDSLENNRLSLWRASLRRLWNGFSTGVEKSWEKTIEIFP